MLRVFRGHRAASSGQALKAFQEAPETVEREAVGSEVSGGFALLGSQQMYMTV